MYQSRSSPSLGGTATGYDPSEFLTQSLSRTSPSKLGRTTSTRSATQAILFSPPLNQRIDSTWAIGGPKARMLEKRPYTHKLNQYFHAPFDVSYEVIAKQRNLRLLESLFYEADEDGSGTMDIDEFTTSLNNEKIKAAFARLGIQPHQSELVFKTLDVHKTGELSIGEFMGGLTNIVGSLDFSMQANELDVKLLRPGKRKKSKQQEEEEKQKAAMRRSSSTMLPPLEGAGTKAQSDQLHRAFVHAALAQALHPATASKR
eukprot:TRINITY_DN11829_c0_g1_i1.p1 TRINITY_DN11829_c0_g1~~TRINITY_DN11829_c0_g1_i1.p1  ORF type:complete len:259 (-),score=70.40 TRINITY_DN11829_c0_g1_i1:351-1127(-)